MPLFHQGRHAASPLLAMMSHISDVQPYAITFATSSVEPFLSVSGICVHSTMFGLIFSCLGVHFDVVFLQGTF